VQRESLPLRAEPPSRPAESLSGLIERVTFHNDDTGFAVLKVKAKGHRDLVSVVGSLASVSAGEWVTAEGRWIQDKEFGLLFGPDAQLAIPAVVPLLTDSNFAVRLRAADALKAIDPEAAAKAGVK